MNVEHYLENYVNELNTLNDKTKEKYNLVYVSDDITKKPVQEVKKTKEMKDYENTMRIYKNEFITHQSRVEDIDIFELSIEEKKNHIINFMARKKYKLVDENLDSLDELLNDTLLLKKKIHLSKTHSIIEKIDFLKKVEHNEYTIDLKKNEKKKISKKNFFKK